MDFNRILRAAIEYKWVVLASMIVFPAGAIFLAVQEPRYQVITYSFQVDDIKAVSPDMQQVSSHFEEALKDKSISQRIARAFVEALNDDLKLHIGKSLSLEGPIDDQKLSEYISNFLIRKPQKNPEPAIKVSGFRDYGHSFDFLLNITTYPQYQCQIRWIRVHKDDLVNNLRKGCWAALNLAILAYNEFVKNKMEQQYQEILENRRTDFENITKTVKASRPQLDQISQNLMQIRLEIINNFNKLRPNLAKELISSWKGLSLNEEVYRIILETLSQQNSDNAQLKVKLKELLDEAQLLDFQFRNINAHFNAMNQVIANDFSQSLIPIISQLNQQKIILPPPNNAMEIQPNDPSIVNVPSNLPRYATTASFLGLVIGLTLAFILHLVKENLGND